MMAGTLNYSAVDDMATDPIAATQTAPNAYALTGYPSFTVTGATQSTAAVTNSLNLATVAPAQSCYPGATWTVAGMTPSGYNGTFTLATGSGPYACGCYGNTITYGGTAIGPATVMGTATPAGGQPIAVAAGSYINNSRITTFTLSGTPPAWECYPGAVWIFAGNNPTNLQRNILRHHVQWEHSYDHRTGKAPDHFCIWRNSVALVQPEILL